jgi:hypothetical protein
MEPDAIQSTDAQGKQRPLVLEPAELPLDGTARAVEPSDSRGINGCSRENSGLIAASCVRRAMMIVGLMVVAVRGPREAENLPSQMSQKGGWAENARQHWGSRGPTLGQVLLGPTQPFRSDSVFAIL